MLGRLHTDKGLPGSWIRVEYRCEFDPTSHRTKVSAVWHNRRRFPPVPDTLWETIKAGYTQMRGFGGCNDLVISGHGAFWTLVPLAFQVNARIFAPACMLIPCRLVGDGRQVEPHLGHA